jgi:hypothetical protein
VTKETDEFWAEKARSMTQHELEAYVKGVRTWSGLRAEAGQPEENANCAVVGAEINQPDGDAKRAQGFFGVATAVQQNDNPFGNVRPAKTTVTITMELSSETADWLQKLKGDGDYEMAMKKLFEYRDEALEREKPAPVETESRHIPAEIERYVIDRDSGTCAFPGCHRAYAHLHHADGFALRQVHDPDRIFCLCEAHHGLAHRGLIENEGLPARWWRVRSCADKADPRFCIDQKVSWHKMVAT